MAAATAFFSSAFESRFTAEPRASGQFLVVRACGGSGHDRVSEDGNDAQARHEHVGPRVQQGAAGETMVVRQEAALRARTRVPSARDETQARATSGTAR